MLVTDRKARAGYKPSYSEVESILRTEQEFRSHGVLAIVAIISDHGLFLASNPTKKKKMGWKAFGSVGLLIRLSTSLRFFFSFGKTSSLWKVQFFNELKRLPSCISISTPFCSLQHSIWYLPVPRFRITMSSDRTWMCSRLKDPIRWT